MNLMEAIEKRKSIRKFDSRKVDSKIIEEILFNGSLAPSAKNRQPWRFVVIREDEGLKNKIADIMLEKVEDGIENNEEIESIKDTARIVKEAPVLIVVFNSGDDGAINSNLQSIGACIQNICLSAADLGVGSLWFCDISCCFREVEDLLGKNDISCVAGISLGYPLEDPEARPKFRLAVDELTDWR